MIVICLLIVPPSLLPSLLPSLSSLLCDGYNNRSSSPSAGAVYYGENNGDIDNRRGLSQQPNFQGNLVNIDNQYQGGQCVYVLTDLESSDRDRSVS